MPLSYPVPAATGTSKGTVTLANDLGGTALAPTVVATHLSSALPVAQGGTGITSLGTGVATFLGTPTSANLAAAITDETGTGANVFASSPTMTTPVIDQFGTASGLGSAWTSWTPTFSAALGTFTIGNATVVGAYKQTGKTVEWRLSITFGTTTTMPTLQPRFSLPVTAATYGGAAGTPIGNVHMEDTGNANYFGVVEQVSTTTAAIFAFAVTGTYITVTNLTTTVPFAWGNTDQINMQGTYNCA